VLARWHRGPYKTRGAYNRCPTDRGWNPVPAVKCAMLELQTYRVAIAADLLGNNKENCKQSGQKHVEERERAAVQCPLERRDAKKLALAVGSDLGDRWQARERDGHCNCFLERLAELYPPLDLKHFHASAAAEQVGEYSCE
jgi:hypothetical protein